MIVHRAANIEAKQNFYRIVALGNHAYIQEPRVSRRLIDCIVEIKLIFGPLTRELT